MHYLNIISIAFIIIINLTQISSYEFNEKNIERIKGAINLLLSNIEVSTFALSSFSFSYPKYIISFNNIRVSGNVFDELNITISEENPSIFKVNNITFEFIIDLYFSYYKGQHVIRKKDSFINTPPFNLYFEYDSQNNSLKLNSSEYQSIDIISNSIFGSYKYFSEFQKNYPCIYKNQGKKEKTDNPGLTIMNNIKTIINYEIERRQKYINMLSYDFKSIIDQSFIEITCSDDVRTIYGISQIKIYKLSTFVSSFDYNFEMKKLIINDVFARGTFKTEGDDTEKNFTFSMSEHDSILLHRNQISFPKSLDLVTYDKNKNNLMNALCKEYQILLNDLTKKYYNE